MTLWFHDLSALCYLVAAVLGWTGLRSGRTLPWLLGAGVLLQAIGFIGFHTLVPPVSLESSAGGLSLMGWLAASAYLLSLGFARTQAVSGWVAAAAFCFTGGATLELRFFGPTAVEIGGTGAWPHAHVLLAAAGFSALAVASVAGLGYLLKERALKSKRGRGVELPSLESLDRLGYLGLAIGFPLLTLGVITGFGWVQAQGSSLWTRHATLSLIAWIVYFVPVASRLVQGRRGHGTARFLVFGFLVLALSYLGSQVVELGS
jgi:ABC-type uncharacterized transport system permease subunit